MPPEQDHVLVLYRHPLLGEGLARMLAADPALEVRSVPADTPDEVLRELGAASGTVVLEEGGPVVVSDVLASSACATIVVVSISTSTAWTLHREPLDPDAERLVDGIVAACHRAREAAPLDPPGATPAGPGRRPRLARSIRAVTVTG